MIYQRSFQHVYTHWLLLVLVIIKVIFRINSVVCTVWLWIPRVRFIKRYTSSALCLSFCGHNELSPTSWHAFLYIPMTLGMCNVQHNLFFFSYLFLSSLKVHFLLYCAFLHSEVIYYSVEKLIQALVFFYLWIWNFKYSCRYVIHFQTR